MTHKIVCRHVSDKTKAYKHNNLIVSAMLFIINHHKHYSILSLKKNCGELNVLYRSYVYVSVSNVAGVMIGGSSFREIVGFTEYVSFLFSFFTHSHIISSRITTTVTNYAGCVGDLCLEWLLIWESLHTTQHGTSSEGNKPYMRCGFIL